MIRIRVLIVLAGLAAVMGPAAQGHAATAFPSRPIEIVIPYPPGGAAEIVVRPYKERLTQILGQPIVFNFKPGAGGAAGAQYVKNAKPDGYTLMSGSTTPVVLLPLVKKDLGYTMDDFTYACNLTVTPLAWLVKEDGPYKSMKDFLQAAKTKRMKYATPGAHTISHIVMEALGKAAGFQATLVPFPGGNPALASVLGGHTDIGITPGSLGMAGPGKLRVVAVAQEKRSPFYPDVPTLAELGYPIDGTNYSGLEAPKGTPPEIVTKICGAHKQAIDQHGDEIRKFYAAFENSIHFTGPEEMTRIYRAEYDLRKKMIEETGILK